MIPPSVTRDTRAGTFDPCPQRTVIARFARVRVAVPAEVLPGERRVAAVPETVAQMVGAGLDVVVQRVSQQPGARARQVWLPPLPATMALSAAIGRVEPDRTYGLSAVDRRCGERCRGRVRVGRYPEPPGSRTCV